MLTPKNFKCEQCGNCCFTYTVKLSDDDIRRLMKRSLKIEEFAVKDDFDSEKGRYSLKRKNNKCFFLTERNKKYSCQIYDIRPEICRKYPFNESDEIESCKPKKEVKWKIS